MKKIFLSFILVMAVFITGCSNEVDNEVVVEDIDPNEVVVIKDEELEKIVREITGKEEGNILASDMEVIYSININGKETPVYEIDGLEYATSLQWFSFRYGTLKSLDPISHRKTLEELTVSYSEVEKSPSNFNTPNLSSVSFTETNVSDYSFLKDVKTITYLNVTRSGLESIDFINDMDKLESLYLDDNNISDISSIKDKTSLIDVSLHKNQVSNISVLQTCKNLETVNISYNHVNNIEYLLDLENLYQLTAYEELDERIIPREQIDVLLNNGVEVNYHK